MTKQSQIDEDVVLWRAPSPTSNLDGHAKAATRVFDEARLVRPRPAILRRECGEGVQGVGSTGWRKRRRRRTGLTKVGDVDVGAQGPECAASCLNALPVVKEAAAVDVYRAEERGG